MSVFGVPADRLAVLLACMAACLWYYSRKHGRFQTAALAAMGQVRESVPGYVWLLLIVDAGLIGYAVLTRKGRRL